VDSRATQLKSFNPFDADHVAEFFDAEHMFGVSDGFDVIVGNPPYIGMQGHATLFEAVRNTSLGKRFFSGKMDYLYFFFHLGLDLLREGGVLALITTNYFPTASYAKKLIDDFRERSTVIGILNFSEVQIFDSAAGQHNMITRLAKGRFDFPASVVQVKNTMRGRIDIEELTSIISLEHPELVRLSIPQAQLYKNGILAISSQGDSPVDALLDRMAQSNVTLGSIALINQGVVTGADRVSKSHVSKFGVDERLTGDGVFVLSEQALNDLELDEHEMEIIKPWFKNSDIRRYSTNLETAKYLIYADERDRSLESRPKLRAHLEKYKFLLEAGRSSKFPYLTWPRSISFDGPKIVAPQRSMINKFGYNSCDWYASGDVYFITEKSGAYDLFTLLGFLNSDLYLAWFYLRGKRKGEMMELYQMPLTLLPLPALDATTSVHLQRVSQLSKEIWESTASGVAVISEENERLLNSEVMYAFGFSDLDIAALREWKDSWLARYQTGEIEAPEVDPEED
jgi:adenine-specific DNA-methyltransferase